MCTSLCQQKDSEDLVRTDAAGQLEKFENHWKIGASKEGGS